MPSPTEAQLDAAARLLAQRLLRLLYLEDWKDLDRFPPSQRRWQGQKLRLRYRDLGLEDLGEG